jgi:predicted nucleic-acid-binding Zn-ribbon protein
MTEEKDISRENMAQEPQVELAGTVIQFAKGKIMDFETDEDRMASCSNCGYSGEISEFVEDPDDFADSGQLICPDCGTEFISTTEDEGESDESGEEPSA